MGRGKLRHFMATVSIKAVKVDSRQIRRFIVAIAFWTHLSHVSPYVFVCARMYFWTDGRFVRPGHVM